MNIKHALKNGTKILGGKKIKSAALDCEVLLLHSLAQAKDYLPNSFVNDRSWLYAHGDHDLAKNHEDGFFRLVRRREKLEPVAYLTGKKEFFGLEFRVGKNVLVPRPETEIMVEEALREILTFISNAPRSKKIAIADIGTGSGAIAVSLAKVLKYKEDKRRVKIYATDISARVLKMAKINANLMAVTDRILFKNGDLLKALPKNLKIDFLLANLPYMGNDYYYREWLRNGSRPSEFFEIKHEPKKSLLAKNNGLEYFEKFFKQAPGYLAKGAKIFLESDPRQIRSIKNLAKKYLPKHKISVIKDLRGLNRITKIEIY